MDTFDRIAVSIWDIMIAERYHIDRSDTEVNAEYARRIRAAVLSEYGAREPVAWRWDEATYTENDVRGRCWQYNIFGTQKPNTPWMQRNVTPLYAAPASPLLPGLERAAEIYPTYYIKHPDDSYSEANPQPSTAVVGTAPSQEGVGQGDAAANTICKHGKIVSGNGILFCDICQDAIRAEISRLKGEGSGS